MVNQTKNCSASDEEREITRNCSNYSIASEEHQARARYAGRDTDRFFGSFEIDDSEAEEQPGELVPLGLGRSPRGPRQRPRHNSHHAYSFHDYYKLTDEHLGAGAYGTVATCVSKTTGNEYAVKTVDKKKESHTRSRILREVNTFHMCKKQPNIVQLVEWFEDDDCFYMVFEKMRGGPLLQHILKKGYFTEEEARRVTKDIASALKFLHDKGIAHRDVKPENILCTEPDRVSPVKLCDLDLASRPIKVKDNSASDSPPRMGMSQLPSEPDLASPVGSAEFMAPEVVDTFVGDRLKYDKRCDMWSLGVILYIMLCGYAPFQGECDDEECGWMEGQPCDDCQGLLFSRIQRGEFEFPEDEWCMISNEAKDLVRHLLVKEVKQRFTADEVLQHRWLQQSAPTTSLFTPNNLFRNDSARDVQQMTEHFNAMNRLAGRLSTQTEQLSVSNSDEEPRCDEHSQASPTQPPPCFDDSNLSKSTVPLFMMPPDEFWDPLSGQMIYPPGSFGSPTMARTAPTFAAPMLPKPKVHNCDSTLTFVPKPYLNTSISSRLCSISARPSNKKELETCQNAMVKQDSNTDLHQITRETEVNV